MDHEQCVIVNDPEGRKSKFFCETHQEECVEEISPSPRDPQRRAATCPISGDLGGYTG
jgi:hypothetical protein